MLTYQYAESVSDGHPDKIADQISDAILDSCIAIDPEAKVAIETMIKNQTIVISGESSVIQRKPMENAIKKALNRVGLKLRDYQIFYNVSRQSKELRELKGAKDQCIAVGYACGETKELMPAPIMMAHKLMRQYKKCYTDYDYFKADGKALVMMEYSNGIPIRVQTVILSVQYDGTVEEPVAKQILEQHVIVPAVGYLPLFCQINLFTQGGTEADCGVTGRKLMVDNYGPAVEHGGGAFSGKDPTKLDRSAAYMARYLAKKIVSSGRAKTCKITLVYAPGQEQPLAVLADTAGTGLTSDYFTSKLIKDNYDLTPEGIITFLKLRQPMYLETAVFGHFGRECNWIEDDFYWERI